MEISLQIRLASLTRNLIKRCGGYVAAALECDVSKSQLHKAANPNHSYCLKASTIYHLEQACGVPVLSEALVDMSHKSVHERDAIGPVWVGIDLADKATALTVCTAEAVRDNYISVNEEQGLSERIVGIRETLSEFYDSIEPLSTVRGGLS